MLDDYFFKGNINLKENSSTRFKKKSRFIEALNSNQTARQTENHFLI